MTCNAQSEGTLVVEEKPQVEIALQEFKEKYAWDKTLLGGVSYETTSDEISSSKDFTNTSIRDFVNSFK